MKIFDIIRGVNGYLQLLRKNSFYQKIKFYLLHFKPHLSFSIFLHVLIVLFLILHQPLVLSNKFDGEKLIVIDLVQVGNAINVKIATDVGEKSYSQDAEKVKLKKIKQEDISRGGEIISIKQNIKGVKKKPVESASIKKLGNPEKLQSALKSINQEKKEIKINVSEQTEYGVLGKGKVSFNKLKPSNISISDSIRKQFIDCWSVPYGALNVENMMIKVNLELDSSGGVLHAEVVNIKQYNKNIFFRAMADSALRAVYKCSPLKGLPKEEYNLWKDMELVFDPRDMLK